jgi:hypothetical protein
LAPKEEHTPSEVATTDSSLSTLDRQVFMVVCDVGTSKTQPDRYLDDISETRCLPTHPLMRPPMTRTLGVTTIESGTNDAYVSKRLFLSGTSTRLYIKSPTGCTLLLSSASCPSPQ